MRTEKTAKCFEPLQKLRTRLAPFTTNNGGYHYKQWSVSLQTTEGTTTNNGRYHYKQRRVPLQIIMRDLNIDFQACSKNYWLNLVQLFDLTQFFYKTNLNYAIFVNSYRRR